MVGEINAGCGRCDFCLAAMERHCPNRTVLGILGRDGCFAEYLRLPDRNLLAVPDTMADEVAVFTEPVAAACEILEQTRIARNATIAVLGDGRLGAIVAMVLKANEYAAVVGGHHREKLARLNEIGIAAGFEADLRPGFDVVIDCTGASAGFARAIELVRPRGTIVLKSTAAAAASLNLAPRLNEIVVNEISVVGSRCGRFAPALDMLASGKLDRDRADLRGLSARRRYRGVRGRGRSVELKGFVEGLVKRRSRPGARIEIPVGIDTGGTFTDIVALIDGHIRVHKVLSTPDNPARAVLDGLAAMLAGALAPSIVTYSSTVATNALLEKSGARVALFTNAGFEDLIEIGRQNRTELYALAPTRPEPLVARAMRFGVAQRTLFDGTEAMRLSAAELSRVKTYRRAMRRRSVRDLPAAQLCEPAGRARVGARARSASASNLGLPSNSPRVPRIRTALDHRRQCLRRAPDGHASGDPGARLRGREFARDAIRTAPRSGPRSRVASRCERCCPGPAAGVIGAAGLVRAMGVDRFITFDMGGTSTDVSLFDRRARIRTLSYPNGYAVRTPVVDIHTVGAGGGSIARIDAGGSLRVGPESAGANPGPACYGRGETRP